MTKDEYSAKIAEIAQQEEELKSQRVKVNKEFQDSVLKELEEQGITPGTKVLVKTISWKGDEIETETYFFGVAIVWGEVKHTFHKGKKDGTMSQVNHYLDGNVISIQKVHEESN